MIKIITKSDAIASLRPGSNFIFCGDELDWQDSTQTRPTESEINAEIARLQAEYDANEYQRKRAAEYPSFADQFDTIFHDGIDAWKEQINTIKEKYPKG
jgi:hypothetical protein